MTGIEAAAQGLHLGMDLGTTYAKAALFDGSGAAVAHAARPVELVQLGPSMVEQDQQAVVATVSAVVRRLLRLVPSSAVTSVAVTGQGDGCWLTGADGSPTRAAVSWMDGRSASVVDGWTRDGTVQRVFDLNGQALFPGSQAAILAWLAEHEPEALERSATAAYCKDMVFARLTGERSTDPSDASLPFGSPTGEGYCDTVLDACGLAKWRHLLAPVVRPLPHGELSQAGGRLLGLRAGIPVTSGPYDVPSCAVGAGLADVGDGLLVVGTSLGCEVLADAPPRLAPGSRPQGMTLATAEPGRWLRVQATMLGCASLDWTLATLGLVHDDIDPALEASEPGAGGVEALPYLAPSGERAPFVAPEAAGQFTGIRLTTTRQDLVRAMCESLAYAARECFEAAGRSAGAPLAVCGGGSRSLRWLRIFATVLQAPLRIARLPEVGARGAVLSALRARGVGVDSDAWTAPSAIVEPEAALTDRYAEGYDRYLSHRRAAQALWRRR